MLATKEPTTDLEFTGLARLAANKLALAGGDVSAVEDDWIERPDLQWADRPGESYIDLVELDQALAQYYAGTLDYVDPVNCCNELSNLVPGKPLISQLDSDDMKRALSMIASDMALSTYIFHSTLSDEHAKHDYTVALNCLAEVVKAKFL